MIILLDEILAAIRQFYRAGLAAFLVIVMLTVGIIVIYPRKYQSRAKLLIRLGREHMVPDATATHSSGLMQLHRTSEHEMNTAVAEMSSRAILEKVVSDAGAAAIIEGFVMQEQQAEPTKLQTAVKFVTSFIPKLDPIGQAEKAIVLLEKDLEIEAPKDSNVVSIKFTSKSPELAQEVVASWVNGYVESHGQLSNDNLLLDFLTKQEALLNDQLAAARERLQNEKDRSGLASISGQQMLLESRLRSAADRRDEIESERIAVRERASKLSHLLSAISNDVVVSETSGLGDSAYDGIMQIIFALETEQKGVASTMKEGHPRRSAVDNQLNTLKDVLSTLESQRKTSVTAQNPTFLELEKRLLIDEAEAVALEHKLELAKSSHQAIVAQIEQLNADEGKIAELSREIALYEKLCSEQASRVEQAKFDQALHKSKVSSISIIQPATLEEKPVSPRVLLSLLLGGMSAVLAGVGLPFFLYDRERTLRRAVNLSEARDPSLRVTPWAKDWMDPKESPAEKSILSR